MECQFDNRKILNTQDTKYTKAGNKPARVFFFVPCVVFVFRLFYYENHISPIGTDLEQTNHFAGLQIQVDIIKDRAGWQARHGAHFA